MKRSTLLFFPLLAGSFAIQAQSKPIDVSLGWNYAYADEGDGFANLNGWYGTVVWEATKRVGLAFTHESYWGGYERLGTNQHIYLGGISILLRPGDHKVNPFLQPFGGVTRASFSDSVQEQPTFELTAGADITLHKHLSLEVIPAEYSLAYSEGSALNTFQAAAGFAYKFGR